MGVAVKTALGTLFPSRCFCETSIPGLANMTKDCQVRSKSVTVLPSSSIATYPQRSWVSIFFSPSSARKIASLDSTTKVKIIGIYPNIHDGRVKMSTPLFQIVGVQVSPGQKGKVYSLVESKDRSDSELEKSSDKPPSLLLAAKSITEVNSANVLVSPTATNGPLPSAPNKGSPAPQGSQGPPVPNGKPTSPYVERSNPMGPQGQISAQTVSSKDPKAAAQAASDMRNVVRRKLTGYVGFANLPNQWHRKSVRKGFNFNVMVVGTFQPSTYQLGMIVAKL